MIFKDFQGFSTQNESNPQNSGFYGYVWSGLKGSEWGVQEINARNEELSMSRRAQYILKFSNSKNS